MANESVGHWQTRVSKEDHVSDPSEMCWHLELSRSEVRKCLHTLLTSLEIGDADITAFLRKTHPRFCSADHSHDHTLFVSRTTSFSASSTIPLWLGPQVAQLTLSAHTQVQFVSVHLRTGTVQVKPSIHSAQVQSAAIEGFEQRERKICPEGPPGNLGVRSSGNQHPAIIMLPPRAG
nr:hypothetical protein CFP56_13052 [Quercus suber]